MNKTIPLAALFRMALVLAGSLWLGLGCKPGSDTDTPSVDNSYEVAERAMTAARLKDPAWQPTHEQTAVIKADNQAAAGALNNFCLNTNGNVLAGYAGAKKGAASIKVFSPDGKLQATWPLESQPDALCVHPDGSIFVGGSGKLLKLSQEGKVLASTDTPNIAKPVKYTPEAGAKVSATEVKNYTSYLSERKKTVTGIAVSGQDLFVTCPSTSDFSYTVYRLDLDSQNAREVVTGLRGCCGQMDLQARDGKLWIPHNARHSVECRDRDGKQLLAFGKRDPKAASGFGGCCEPKNLRLVANGDLYTAESGPPVVVKRFSSEGKFLNVAVLPAFSSGCVRVSVDVSADGKNIFLLNTGDNSIRVFAPKG